MVLLLWMEAKRLFCCCYVHREIQLGNTRFQRVEKAVPRLYANDKKLEKLKMLGNGAEKAKIFAKALAKNTTLKELNFSHFFIEAEGAIAFRDALMQNSSLIHLDLFWTGICYEGVKALADALKKNTTLNTLLLGMNRFGVEGAKAIADALKHNNSLTTLDLRYNFIGDEGAKAIAGALKENTKLGNLDLCDNGIGEEGAKALTDALTKNLTLWRLLLNTNSYDYGNIISGGIAERNSFFLRWKERGYDIRYSDQKPIPSFLWEAAANGIPDILYYLLREGGCIPYLQGRQQHPQRKRRKFYWLNKDKEP